jgi:hypothetical protein
MNHEGAGVLIYMSMKGIIAYLTSNGAGFVLLGPPFGTTKGTNKKGSILETHFTISLDFRR